MKNKKHRLPEPALPGEATLAEGKNYLFFALGDRKLLKKIDSPVVACDIPGAKSKVFLALGMAATEIRSFALQ